MVPVKKSRSRKAKDRSLLIGFASDLLSESSSQHVFDFVRRELCAAGQLLVSSVSNAFLTSEQHFDDQPEIETIYESSSDEDEGSLVQSLLLCSDDEFYHMFRMKRTSIQALLEILTSYHTENPILQATCPNITLHQKVLVTVWLLGNRSTVKKTAHLFGLSRMDTEACFLLICGVLVNLMPQLIKWPKFVEEEEVVRTIEEVYGFPGVVGVLGNTTLELPRSYGTSRKTVMLIQAVVDNDMVFRDVFVGPPSVDSAATVFQASPLYVKLTSKKKPLISPHRHLIAGKEYPQLTTLLTPYRARDLIAEEIRFNEMLERTHGLVEKVFHVLVQRFRRLRDVDVTEADHVGIVVTAACVLHNFLLKIGDVFNTGN